MIDSNQRPTSPGDERDIGGEPAPSGTPSRPALSRLVVVALILTVFVGSLPFLASVNADPDLWWHVRSGETILDDGGLPEVDDWSFTAAGATWTNHEWLADVIFAQTYDAAGSTGLLLLRGALFVLLVGGLVVAFSNRVRTPLVVLLLIMFTVPVLGTFINVRAHSFSYTLVVWAIVVLDRVREGRWRWLALLPAIMLLWVNLHGGFVLGLALIGLSLFLVLVGWDGMRRRPTGRAQRLVILGGIGTLAITLLNPHGIGLFSYLAYELGANHSIVSEWQRPAGVQLTFFWLYLLIPLGLWILARRWHHVGLPLMLLVTAYSTFRHARFFVLMGLFGSIVAAGALGAIMRRLEASGRLGALERTLDPKAAVAALVVLVVIFGASFVGDVTSGDSGVKVDKSLYPIDATEWLAAQDVGPNLAIPLPYGGYSIWHLGPDTKVSIDGRNLTVYDDDWVDRYLRSLVDGTALEVLDEAAVDVWMLPSDSKQIAALEATGRWGVAYRDPIAVVLLEGHDAAPALGEVSPGIVRFP